MITLPRIGVAILRLRFGRVLWCAGRLYALVIPDRGCSRTALPARQGHNADAVPAGGDYRIAVWSGARAAAGRLPGRSS